MTSPDPRKRYHAYVATAPTGEMVLAIAHMEPDGAVVIDHVNETTVSGGEAGIDAVYQGLRAQGIEVNDFRAQAGPHRVDPATVRARAIAGATDLVRQN